MTMNGLETEINKGFFRKYILKPVSLILIAAATGGAGIYLGAKNSDDVNHSIDMIKQDIKIAAAPKYETIIEDFRNAERIFTMYEPQIAEYGRQLICEEINSLPGYACVKLDEKTIPKQKINK